MMHEMKNPASALDRVLTDNSLQSLLSCTVLSGIPRYPQKLLNLMVMQVHVGDISLIYFICQFLQTCHCQGGCHA